jgi:hypothetical protein
MGGGRRHSQPHCTYTVCQLVHWFDHVVDLTSNLACWGKSLSREHTQFELLLLHVIYFVAAVVAQFFRRYLINLVDR